jgi:hypothetical protein
VPPSLPATSTPGEAASTFFLAQLSSKCPGSFLSLSSPSHACTGLRRRLGLPPQSECTSLMLARGRGRTRPPQPHARTRAVQCAAAHAPVASTVRLQSPSANAAVTMTSPSPRRHGTSRQCHASGHP